MKMMLRTSLVDPMKPIKTNVNVFRLHWVGTGGGLIGFMFMLASAPLEHTKPLSGTVALSSVA